MATIPGYQLSELLYKSPQSLIYRGCRNVNQTSVILKILNQEYPTPDAIARFRLEYEITHKLNLEGVVKAYALETFENSLAIILEDFGGESLRQQIQFRQFTLKECLSLSIAITKIIGQVHQQNIIHKDINPSNLVINPNTGQVKLIDFGIATVLSRENPIYHNPNILEGTLAYLSPEQTGRMNRSIDYRTDFYSLGVTLYQLLSHQLPFKTSDAVELVHCQIAKQPISVDELNSSIPQAVSNIVSKLLAKNAEDRYQSSWGIQSDLEKCLAQLQEKGRIETFILGEQDISERFQILQKLYGREQNVKSLLSSFDQVIENKELKIAMALVTGYSGIGKTALVQEIYKPITERRGYFISGKFEPLKQNIPYHGLIQAFRELIQQLLTQNEHKIRIWKEQILEALGMNGQIMIDVIPEVELLIGEQPAVIELNAEESQNRFNWVFQNFIQVFPKVTHPLVIFLDDLQWADRASLKLIQSLLVMSECRYLLLIGTYRENEISRIHPLQLMLNELKKTNVSINHISLLPLNLAEINQLIADSLNSDLETTQALAELVWKKTNGNPFFINEFLKYLYQESLISFNSKNRKWHWNLKAIQAVPSTDNVVDLMVAKIQKLSNSLQQVLKLAACIGHQFDTKTLSIIYEKTQAQTVAELWQAVQEGLVLPIGDDYKYFQFFNLENSHDVKVSYQFLHDRVRQAAYSTLSEIEQQQIHLKIGQFLQKSTPSERLEDQIFEIVNQLNLGIELITEQPEKAQLAQLNLIAGQKAKLSAAYEPAFNYFKSGLKLLDQQSSDELILNLLSSAAEAAYLCGDFEQMEQFAQMALQQAKNHLDLLTVYEVKIQAYIAQNQLSEAINIGLQVLDLLGVKLSPKPTQKNIQLEQTKTKLALDNKEPLELMNLPLMSDPDKLAAMQIIASVCTPTYFTAPQVWKMMVFQKVQLSLQYGNAPGSAFGYADYGMILCAVEEKIDAGYRFAELALKLLPQLKAQEFIPKTLLLVNMYLKHWKEHLRVTLEPLLEAYQYGLTIGDLEYATFALAFRFYHSYLVGRSLSELEQEMASYRHAIAHFKQELPLNLTQIYHQAVLNLMEASENPWVLSGTSYDERECLPRHQATNDQYTIFHLYLNKLMLAYLFQDYPQAVELADTVEQLLEQGAVGLLVVPVFYFYDSLSKIAIFPDASIVERKNILKKIAANQKKMKLWADHAPMNYLHKYYLVEAERYRILGQDLKAMDAYDRAINLAKEHEYLNEEALAHELAARFYLARNKDKIAQVYLLDAYYCYLNWGAMSKMQDLEARYLQLLAKRPEKTQHLTITTVTGSTRNEVLDLATVIKANHALSGEILLDKLLAKLMKILMENAGAEKGLLILETQGKLLIEAEGSVNNEQISVLKSRPVNLSLPASIINYVARTQENVVLHNATQENKFNQDAYIIASQPKSILCIPLVNQGKLAGILYLENNLTTDAFTTQRIEILQLLSVQAAIAIDNARLYNELEIRVQERTEELTQSNQRLEQLTAELQRSNQELEQFAYIASHDLQEPLRAVASYTQLLAKRYQGKLDEKADIYINFAVNGATRMQQLIRDLLAYSKVGRHQLKRQPTDCNFVVNQVLKDLQLCIRENQATITIEPLPTLLADPDQMMLLFQNLISNAIKYRSSIPPQIRISATQHQPTSFIFRVSDNGIGIDTQYAEQIFGIFQRLHSSDEYPGTGLGLAICQKIVERHEGQIWVESQPGEGSSFCFEIPVRPHENR
ncbi:AAA family ATPase [Chroococcus sp. FPU101]|uniref:AAA family ATPase n=1 Tax=Chroococcus sp. FPU101 TaxID=1974212 RepID=UPI001A8F8783|nr:AAA family ATPase [Chroococcus sp. FPU101]GFE69952.1 multi-sensor signal transduction multi-kinase [Chroococcus sp. FPU101]